MNASVRFVVWGSMPLAALVAGWLGSAIGVTATLWAGVVGSLATVLPILTIDRLMDSRTVATRAQETEAVR
jgi:amino acid permease